MIQLSMCGAVSGSTIMAYQSVTCKRPDHCADDACHSDSRDAAVRPCSSFQSIGVDLWTSRQACSLLRCRQRTLTDHFASVNAKLFGLLIQNLPFFSREVNLDRCSALCHLGIFDVEMMRKNALNEM
jgi:hypothetical protein